MTKRNLIILFLEIIFAVVCLAVLSVTNSSGCQLGVQVNQAGEYLVSDSISKNEWEKKRNNVLVGGRFVNFKVSFRCPNCNKKEEFYVKGVSYNKKLHRFEIYINTVDRRFHRKFHKFKINPKEGIPLEVELRGIKERINLTFLKDIDVSRGSNRLFFPLEKSDFFYGDDISPQHMEIKCRNGRIKLVLIFNPTLLHSSDPPDPSDTLDQVKKELLDYLENENNYKDNRDCNDIKQRESNEMLNNWAEEDKSRSEKYQNYKDNICSFLTKWKNYSIYLQQKSISENEKKFLEKKLENLNKKLKYYEEIKKQLEKIENIYFPPTKYVLKTACKIIPITDEVNEHYYSLLNYLKKKAVYSYYPEYQGKTIKGNGKIVKESQINWRALVTRVDQRQVTIKIKEKELKQQKMFCCVSAILALEPIEGKNLSQKDKKKKQQQDNKNIIFYDDEKPMFPSKYEPCEDEDNKSFNQFVNNDWNQLKNEKEKMEKQAYKYDFDDSEEKKQIVKEIEQKEEEIQNEKKKIKQEIEKYQKEIKKYKSEINKIKKEMRQLRTRIEQTRQRYIESMIKRKRSVIGEGKGKSRKEVVDELIKNAKEELVKLVYSNLTSVTKEQSTYSEEPEYKLVNVRPFACYREPGSGDFWIIAKFDWIIKIPENKAGIRDLRSNLFEQRKSEIGDTIYYDRLYEREWWFVKGDVEKYGVAYRNAKKYFQENGGGWRLPTQEEIRSLKVYGSEKVSVIDEVNKYPGPYWLSEIDDNSYRPLGYCFKIGKGRCSKEVDTYSASEGLKLILVRDKAWK